MGGRLFHYVRNGHLHDSLETCNLQLLASPERRATSPDYRLPLTNTTNKGIKGITGVGTWDNESRKYQLQYTISDRYR